MRPDSSETIADEPGPFDNVNFMGPSILPGWGMKSDACHSAPAMRTPATSTDVVYEGPVLRVTAVRLVPNRLTQRDTVRHSLTVVPICGYVEQRQTTGFTGIS